MSTKKPSTPESRAARRERDAQKRHDERVCIECGCNLEDAEDYPRLESLEKRVRALQAEWQSRCNNDVTGSYESCAALLLDALDDE